MAKDEWALRFLGVGGSQGPQLGHAAAVLERSGQPILLIDCGHDTLARYQAQYGGLPPALFLTHTHFDHAGGMDGLFYALWFAEPRQRMPLYVPISVLKHLSRRVASTQFVLAEGGVNFWDAFHLVPAELGFWHDEIWFELFPARHHEPGFAFGLRLAGQFCFTGDTRPIPETLASVASDGEAVFHDCALDATPSHTGVEDLLREYPEWLRRQLVLYHYATPEAGVALEDRGFRVAAPGDRIDVPDCEVLERALRERFAGVKKTPC